jgi:hypothetical protein
VALPHFLLDTAWRNGEAVAAEWSWVRWQPRQLRIPVADDRRPKDEDAREVLLGDALSRNGSSLEFAVKNGVAPLAQLDRATASGAVGQRFESSVARLEIPAF